MNDTTTYQPELGQLIEPDPVKYSFNTPGWYIVLGVILTIVLIVVFIQYRKYRKNAYRREALIEVENILLTKNNSAVFEVNRLLKILAIRLFGREKVASLYGKEWYEFLISTLNERQSTPSFSFNNFSKAMYNPEQQLSEKQMDELMEFATHWIKNHDVKNV